MRRSASDGVEPEPLPLSAEASETMRNSTTTGAGPDGIHEHLLRLHIRQLRNVGAEGRHELRALRPHERLKGDVEHKLRGNVGVAVAELADVTVGPQGSRNEPAKV